jgi:hypothetical protein
MALICHTTLSANAGYPHHTSFDHLRHNNVSTSGGSAALYLPTQSQHIKTTYCFNRNGRYWEVNLSYLVELFS